MRMAVCAVVIFCSLIFPGCESKKPKPEAGSAKEGTRVEIGKYPDGTIRARVPYVGKQKHGLATSYDPQGNRSLEIPYEKGKREGVSRRYYEGGRQLYQTTEYKDDQMHGVQRKYRIDGTLLSESRYAAGKPCLGLKEYLADQQLKKKYPALQVKEYDFLQLKGYYRVEVSLSEKVSRVHFYKGKLTKEGCIHGQLVPLMYDHKRRIGFYDYFLPPGGFLMEELSLVAEAKTKSGNTYVVQRTVPISIQY